MWLLFYIQWSPFHLPNQTPFLLPAFVGYTGHTLCWSGLKSCRDFSAACLFPVGSAEFFSGPDPFWQAYWWPSTHLGWHSKPSLDSPLWHPCYYPVLTVRPCKIAFTSSRKRNGGWRGKTESSWRQWSSKLAWYALWRSGWWGGRVREKFVCEYKINVFQYLTYRLIVVAKCQSMANLHQPAWKASSKLPRHTHHY